MFCCCGGGGGGGACYFIVLVLLLISFVTIPEGCGVCITPEIAKRDLFILNISKACARVSDGVIRANCVTILLRGLNGYEPAD